MNQKINRASELVNIEDSYFVRMMLPQAEKIAKPYLDEESISLSNLILGSSKLNIRNVAVVGSGPLWYLDLVDAHSKRYIGIEPLADIFIQDQFKYLLQKHTSIKVIPNRFGEFHRNELPDGNTIFAFIFNILSYIDHPIKKINAVIQEGDVLFISSWNKSSLAKKTRKLYFDYLNALENVDSKKIDPEDTTGLCDLSTFPYNKLKYYKNHQHIIGKVTDTLIIYC